jgi:hypothetical protein
MEMMGRTVSENKEYDQAAHIASIDERVSGLERSIRDVVTAVQALGTELRNSSKTQWPAILAAGSLAVTVITAIGLLAYMPIQQKQTDLDRAMTKVMDSMVSQRETAMSRSYEDRLRDMLEKDVSRHERRLDRMEQYVFRNSPPRP